MSPENTLNVPFIDNFPFHESCMYTKAQSWQRLRTCRDYREMPELDQYDPEDIDDGAVDQDITYAEAQNNRLRAERELDRRDAQEGVTGRRQRLPGALEGISIFLQQRSVTVKDVCSFAHHSIGGHKWWIALKLAILPLCSMLPLMAVPGHGEVNRLIV